ncbi:preprotein translocase subunit SecA [Pseudonocardia sichuanensis]
MASVRTGEALGLAVRPDAVRLRLSAVDRLWQVVRWTVTLAGAVVVLWLGSAFLMATPAAAAVAVPVAHAGAKQSMVKASGARPADGGDGDSGSDGGDGDSEGKSEKKSEKKSDDEKSDDKKPDDKKSEKKSDGKKSEKKSDDDKSDESAKSGKKSKKKESDGEESDKKSSKKSEKKVSDRGSGKKSGSEKSSGEDSRKKSEKKSGHRKGDDESGDDDRNGDDRSSGEESGKGKPGDKRSESTESDAEKAGEGKSDGGRSGKRPERSGEADRDEAQERDRAAGTRSGKAEKDEEPNADSEEDRRDRTGRASGSERSDDAARSADRSSADDRGDAGRDRAERADDRDRRPRDSDAERGARATGHRAGDDRTSADGDRVRADGNRDRADGDRADRTHDGRAVAGRDRAAIDRADDRFTAERRGDRVDGDRAGAADRADRQDRKGADRGSRAEGRDGDERASDRRAERAVADTDGKVREESRDRADRRDPDGARSDRDAGERVRDAVRQWRQGADVEERLREAIQDEVRDRDDREDRGDAVREQIRATVAELDRDDRSDDREDDSAEARRERLRDAVAEGPGERARDGEHDTAAERVRAAVAGLDRDRVERALDRAGDARRSGERARDDDHVAADGAKKAARRLAEAGVDVARELTDRDGDLTRAVDALVDEVAETAGASEGDVRRAVDTARDALSSAADDGDRPVRRAALEPQPTAGADDERSGSDRTAARTLTAPRAPPSETAPAAVLRADEREDEDDEDRRDERDDDGRWVDGEWVDYDDSAEQTEKVLEDRIESDASEKRLAQKKKDVAAGKATKDEYDAQAAEHAEQERRAAEDRARVSPERAELVDEVVDGHRELEEREKELAAEEKRVAAGKADAEAHERDVAAFEAQRDEVYDATDELMDATERDTDAVSSDDLDGEGASAGCGSSGVFVECGSVSEDAEGQRDSDRCVAISGVSSGCGTSSRSGDSESSASCTLTGADRGCGSSASSRGEDGEATRASARCTGDDCEQRSTATPDRADAECRTGTGSCGSSGSGSDRDEPAAAATLVSADRDEREGTGRGTGSGSARCEGAGGCATTSSVELGDEAGDVEADAEVSCGAGCTGSARTRTDAGHEATTQSAPAAERAARSATTGAADCTVSGGGCRASSDSRADGDEGTESDSTAGVSVDCDGAACSGSGTTTTRGSASGVRAGAERASDGTASCEVAGGDCEASSRTGTETEVDEDERWTLDAVTGLPVASRERTDGDASAASSVGASVDCDDAAGCTGTASGATTGTVTGTAATGSTATGSTATGPAAAGAATEAAGAPVRTTSTTTSCTATGGSCDTSAASEVSDRAGDAEPQAWPTGATEPARELMAVSTASAGVDCAVAGCTGSGSTTTKGAASGDVTGVRDSTATSSCTARGDGGSCSAAADTAVADREPALDPVTGVAAVSGPVSVSHASATVECDGGSGTCGGTATSSTSARDTGVSPHARGTSATAECTVTGGACSGGSSSSASSAPDFAAVDPATGMPTTGPSSTATSTAGVACAAGSSCTGTARTSTSAWDGAVNGGTPRTSTGEATCTGTGGCEAQSVSHASSAPGAALAFAGAPQDGGDQQVNAARLPAGPSAASAAGAATTCAGAEICDGRVTSAATATDPAVSPEPRGSRSEGSCAGVSGAVCQAVTNSGASSGPDANVIVPLVQARSTANADVSSEDVGTEAPADQQQDQPATLPAPAAPGSSANSGAPTVPGASSWTMAAATLDCAGAGGCTGTARTSATGTDGPTAGNGAGGARGPPTATGTTSSSGSCTSEQSGCRVQTDSSAGSGQVVADIVAEDRTTAAEQARAQAVQAEAAARDAARVAARPGATAAERRAAAEAATAAQQAKQAHRDAATLAAQPVTDAPATLSRSGASARCAGPGCTAATTGGTSGTAGTTRTAATCTAADSGCLVTSGAIATAERSSAERADGAERDSGAVEDGAPVPGSSGEAQAASQLVCPEAGCTGTVTGDSSSVAGPADRRSAGTATGSSRCDGTTACLAQVSVTASRATGAPEGGEPFATTSASVAATCDDGSATGCATTASSRTTADGGPGVRGTSTATCAASGGCAAATGGHALDGVVQTTAECAGTGCRTRTDGTAQAAVAGGTTRATSHTDCTAGAGGSCAGSSLVGASAEGSQASASCAGSTGATCRHSFSSTTDAHSRTGGNVADARASCGTAGGTGTGWCATGAEVHTTGRTAAASATCAGSAGSGCSYSYRAGSADSAASSGSRASARASGSGSGTFGGGYVATAAAAAAGPGTAQAMASCTGSAGVRCSHSYSASASDSASSGGNRASASASGSGGGGIGGGGVAVMAQASAGPGSASASASCAGAANCRHSYSASASAAASYGGNRASASASGSGGGGGGVAVSAQASAGPGSASASASCAGAANCRHSYSASASAAASHGGNWARAFASGSGGGGQGSGGVSVSAQASAGPSSANASASCSGAANCRWGYSGHASSSASYDDGTHRSWAHASASGSGGGSGPGGGGLSVFAQTSAGKGWANAAAGCSGAANCSASYSAGAEASKTVGGQHAEASALCSGGGSGGSCGAFAVVEVDSENALAQAGCSGSGSCEAHYATSSDSTGSGTGQSGESGADCSGSANGGYCATGSKVTYDAETGTLQATSYCATEGGSCSKYANVTIDASFRDGQFTGDGESSCSGAGAGACSAIGVVKMHEATTDAEGNRISPTLVIGTGCAIEGGGSCSQHSNAYTNITGADGKIGASSVAECSGTTGYCTTVVGGTFLEETGEIDAFADCSADGGSGCTKVEAHLHGEVSGAGQANPDGPTEGVLHGDGNAHCVRTSGTCAVSGVFDYVPAAMGEDQDGDGQPDAVPAHVIAATSCYPEGDHCTQETSSWATLDRTTEHTVHHGDANADCSGTWGSCSTVASVAYDEEQGEVTAFAQCDDAGGANCTRASTSTYAWAQSPHGEDLRGHGVSECNQTGGYCSSVSFAKYYGDGEVTVPGENGEDVALPAHVRSGAGCGTDGAEDNCSFNFSARGFEELTEDDGLLAANARSNCSDSGTTGSGWCSVAADATIDLDARTATVDVWCQGSTGVSCSYSGYTEAYHEADKNNAESLKQCGAEVAGNCSLAAAAVAAGGDREKQGQAIASGFCHDSNGTCSGEFRTHVDSNRDTLSDCESSGAANGTCFGLAVRDHAMSGGQFFGDPDANDEITLGSQAPGRDRETRTCSATSACDTQQVDEDGFTLDGEYFVLDVEEDKSALQFGKNALRDLGDVVVYAIPGLLESVGTELWSGAKYDVLWFDEPEQMEGESDLEYYTRLYPFTGGVATGAVNFYNRWINFEDGGTDWGRLGEDYYYAPVSTLLEDVGTIALAAAGAGAIIKGVSMGARAAGAGVAASGTVNGLRASLTSLRSMQGVPALDAAAGVAFRGARWTGNVAMAPLTANFLAGRVVAAGLSRGIMAPLAGRSRSAAEVAAGRAGAAFEFGRYSEAVALQSRAAGLGRRADVLDTAAYAGRVISKDGLFGRMTRDGRTPGLIGTLRAYDALGLRFGRTATTGQIASAYTGASVRAFGTDLLGPRTLLGRLAGHEFASALRQRRADRARALVGYDQLMFGGTFRNPNRLAGRGVWAAHRARALTEIAAGRLTAQEFAELTRSGLDRLADDVATAPRTETGRAGGADAAETTAGTARGSRSGEQVDTHGQADTPAQGGRASEQGAAVAGDRGGRSGAQRGAAADDAAGRAGDDGTPATGDPAPTGPRPADPADPVLPTAPRSGDRLGGGQRPSTGGDGPDPLATGAGGGSGPRPRPEEPAPARPAKGHPTEPDPLTSDLPPPGPDGTPARQGSEPPARTNGDLSPEVAQVRTFWEEFRQLSDAQLRNRYRELADDVRSERKKIDEVAVECTALACEASRRNGKAPHDEQIEGALALVRDDLIEMRTGEGKTLTGALAAVVRGLDARDAAGNPGVHRGVQWMALNPKDMRSAVRTVRPIAERLGLTVGEVRPGALRWSKQRAYQADIAIGTVSEFVFDALRARNAKGDPVHGNRGGYRLIDEVDQVLFDEALTPHVLAAARGGRAPLGDLAWSARIATELEPRNGTTPGYYEIGRNGVRLTPDGIAFIKERTGRDLTTRRNAPLVRRVENALAFELVVRKDVEYFVEDGRVVIVDRRTGYALDGRRWNDGLHEAIEYAERLEVQGPTRALDAMTVVDFLGDRPFGGMTGTIGGKAGRDAFRAEYSKTVVEIRPHRDPQRIDLTAPTYRTAAQKWDGVFDDVVTAMRSGRPVLVVTGSILEAAQFAARLRRAGIEPNVLTARTRGAVDDRIIAEAGRPGQVTVATNKAGRGIDIQLGGEAKGPKHDAVEQAGGLHVVLTEFPESLRVEQQARGRAGRQGEKGSSTLHRSLEDRILQPVGKGELTATRNPREAAPVALDSAAVEALFTLGRQQAELAARGRRGAQQARTVVEERRQARGVLGSRGVPQPTELSSVPANPAGIDLPQLAALRAGHDVPGLSPELNAQLRELVDGVLVEEPATASEHAAAARVAEHLPQRSFQPYEYTEADLAAVTEQLARLTQEANAVQRGIDLRDRLGMDADAFAATMAVAEQLLAERQGAGPDAVPPTAGPAADRLRLDGLRDRELQALVDWVRGVPEDLVAQRLGIAPQELGWFLGLDEAAPGVVVDKLTRATRNNALLGGREPAGRQVRTEAATRDAAMARDDGTAGRWQRVRDALRAVELNGLHPVEAAALWDRDDRIEEFVGLLPARHRDVVHGALVDAGVTSLTQLAGLSLDALADLGMPATATRAVRAALATVPAPQRVDALDRHVAADLAGRTAWTHEDLLAALHVAAGREYDPSGPATHREIAELRGLLGLDALAALADLLLERVDAGQLRPEERALLPVEALDLLVRARAGALTDAERLELVARGSGALRMRAAGPDQLVALLVLDADVHAGREQPAPAPLTPAPAPHRFPTATLVGTAAAVGAAGGAAAVLAGSAPTLAAGASLVGATVGAAVVTAVHRVRNRGPPAGRATTSPAAAHGVTARRWIDRIVIGAPLMSDPVVRHRTTAALVGASALGWSLATVGVPGGTALAVGAAVGAVAVELAPRVRDGLALRAAAGERLRGMRDRTGDRLRDAVRAQREALAAARRRWAADRALRSVLAGLDGPVRAGEADLAAARADLLAADAEFGRRQQDAVRDLYDAPDARSGDVAVDAAREAAVAHVLGLDRTEVRRQAGAAGADPSTDLFDERLVRVADELQAAEARLGAAVDAVDAAGRLLAERRDERSTRLTGAIRAAAAGGVAVARIAALTGLTPAQVRAIVGETPRGGSGPSATGGGPGTGGGGPTNPTGTGPERRSAPQAGSPTVTGAATGGPSAAGPEARSRGPPWRQLWTTRTTGAVVLFAGLAAALVAARYGAVEPGALAAAGIWWWPGQRRAARELRDEVAAVRDALGGAEQADAGARMAVRQDAQVLQDRLGWVPALAERLRQRGRTDEQVVADLAAALSVHPVRVRARLVDPDLAGAVELPAPLAAAGLTAAELLEAVRSGVTARADALETALAQRDAAAEALDTARTEAQERIREAATAARDAGVRAGTVRRATELTRADVTALPAAPPTVRDALRPVGTWFASGWQAGVGGLRAAGRWTVERGRDVGRAAGTARQWSGERVLAAVAAAGRGRQRIGDRIRADRALRVQVRGVARLRAAEGAIARLLHREQRAARRAVTTEQLGWIGWVSVVASAQPAGTQPSREQLAERLAEALQLPGRTARRLLTRADRLAASQVRPPQGGAATGTTLDLAVAAVATAFAGAHRTLADAAAAHRAAGQALAAGRTEAVHVATAAGAAPDRAERRADRAARGRGAAGLRHRLGAGLGLDVPLAERLRPRRAALAGLVTGVGAGLVAGGLAGVVVGGPAVVAAGSVLVAAGLLAAVRAMWTPATARGPPSAAFLRGLRAHGLRLGLWTLGGVGAVLGAGPLAGLVTSLWPVFAHQPGLLGVKALLTPAITAGLVFRYVLRRQHANQASGMQTRPRQAAWTSAIGAYVLTAGLGLVRAFGLAANPWWLVPVAMAIGVGIAAAILQKKDTGRTRVFKAMITGALSAGVAFVVGLLGTAVGPGATRELVATLVIATVVYGAPSVIAEYVNVWVGRAMAPFAKSRAEREARKAAAADGHSDRQRSWYFAWLDYKNFSPVDTRLLARKALDPVLAGLAAVVVNLAWMERAWVLANDGSLTVVLGRFAAMATTVWLIGKLLRDPDEVAGGFYGFRSSRALRLPSRAPWWSVATGGRLHHRAAHHGRDLERALEQFGLSRRTRDRGLAHDLAALLWDRMTAPVHEPLPEWDPLPAEIDGALARERAAAQRRRDQHVETIALVVPVLAADPGTMVRVADRLRRAGRTADAAVLDFQRMLAQELWAQFTAARPEPDATPVPEHRTWAEQLARALAERAELRADYLAGPRKELLEHIKRYHLDADRGNEWNARYARAQLRALEFERQGMSKPRREPLEAVAQLADQRARSVGIAAATEQWGIESRDPAASTERLVRMQQLEAGMRVLGSAALLAIEAELSATQRNWDRKRWRAAMAAAGTSANPQPVTLLDRLLLVAGRRGTVSAAHLEAQYDGTGWAEALTALVEAGALETVDGGYRAAAEVRSLWRAAAPRLRRAVRSGVTELPGGTAVAPLLVERPAGGGPQERRDAVAALLDVLRNGDLAFRHWRDGWIDDAGSTWRRLTALGHRHGPGRRDWPLPAGRSTAPVRVARGLGELVAQRWRHRVEPGRQRRALRNRLRAADAADRLYVRARRAAEFLADQRPDVSLRPEATDLLHAARVVEVEAYARLGEDRGRAVDALAAVGSYPHQVDRTLSATDAALAHAPGADPLPPTAEHWLKEITRELDAARARLDGLHPGPGRDRALDEARLSLARHAIDRDYGWASQLHRTMGGWNVMEAARAAASRLRAAHPDLFRVPAAPEPGHSPVVPHRDRVEHPYGDEGVRGPGMAAETRRGRGNRTNQDAATLATLPDGARVALVVDGVFSYPASRTAATTFAAAFRAELLRTDRPGRTAAQLLQDAHEAGLGALTAAYTPEAGHGAVAYLAAHHAADGTVTTSHVGTARAFHVPFDRTQPTTQITVDDSRGGAITDGGVMTRWAAGDYRPAPTVTTVRPDEPGLLVLATDGLWRYLPTPDALSAALPAGLRTADAAAQRLAESGHRAGGRDDLTVAVVQAPDHVRGLGRGTHGPRGGTTPLAALPHRMPRGPPEAGPSGPVVLAELDEARIAAFGRLLPELDDRGFLRPLAEVDPLLRASAPVLVLDIAAAGAVLAGWDDVLGALVAYGWHERGAVVVPAPVLAEIMDHEAAGRLAQGFWDELLEHEVRFHLHGRSVLRGAGHDEHAAGLARRLRAARTFGVDPAVGGDVRFRPVRDAAGHPFWELAAPFGTLVITGEQLTVDERVSAAAGAVSEFGESARWWLAGGGTAAERVVQVLGLVAEAATAAPLAVHDHGAVRTARVRVDRQVGAMLWEGGARTRDVELVTMPVAPGRHLLVGFHPVREGAPTGLAGHPALLAGAARSVVAFRDGRGRVVGTGVVVRAATPAAPALVRTAYHVAEVLDGDSTVDGLALSDLRSVPLDAYGPDAELAAAARQYLDLGLAGGGLPTLDLALAAVWGLDRPAAPVRRHPVARGELVTFIGYPEGRHTVTQAPVVGTDRGLLDTIAALGGGVSGGPGFDARGRVVLTVVTGRPGRTYGIGPRLAGRFGDAVTGAAGRPVPPLRDRDAFGRPAPDPERLAAGIVADLAAIAGLVDELAAELPGGFQDVLDTLGDDPVHSFLGSVRERLVTAPAAHRFRLLAERAGAVGAALVQLRDRASAASRAEGTRPLGDDTGAVGVGFGVRLGALATAALAGAAHAGGWAALPQAGPVAAGAAAVLAVGAGAVLVVRARSGGPGPRHNHRRRTAGEESQR